ncbi:MAG: AAA family ATPase [Bacillaceae bacterium]|nr:AAA family ATPase [Bacillaceae bacterium]
MSRTSENKVIVVCGPKGGSGRTVMATNLSIALARASYRVCLIDADFQFGDISILTDIDPRYTVFDYIESQREDPDTRLEDYLIRHSSGIQILPPPSRPEQAELITSKDVESIIQKLSAQFDYLVVDTAVGFHEHTLVAVDQATDIMVVSTMDLSSIQAARQYVDTLSSLGMQDKIRLIMNRVVEKSEIKYNDVLRIFPDLEPVPIPDQPQAVTTSINRGIPLASTRSQTDVARAIVQLAQVISNNEDTTLKIENVKTMNSKKCCGFIRSLFSSRQKGELKHEQPSPTS